MHPPQPTRQFLFSECSSEHRDCNHRTKIETSPSFSSIGPLTGNSPLSKTCPWAWRSIDSIDRMLGGVESKGEKRHQREGEGERASCKVSWEISDFPSTAKYKHVVDDHDFLEQGAERKGEAIESSFPSLERGSEEFADPHRHWNEIGGPPRSTTSLTKRTSSATPRLVLSNFLFRYVANEWRGKKNFSRWPSKFFSARWKFFWYFDTSRMAEVSADVIEDATPTPVGPLINSPGALSFFFLFVSFSLPPWARYKYIFRYRVSVARLCVYCARVRRIFIHIVCWAAAAAVLPKEKGGAEQISQAIFSCVALKEMETRRRERERPR